MRNKRIPINKNTIDQCPAGFTHLGTNWVPMSTWLDHFDRLQRYEAKRRELEQQLVNALATYADSLGAFEEKKAVINGEYKTVRVVYNVDYTATAKKYTIYDNGHKMHETIVYRPLFKQTVRYVAVPKKKMRVVAPKAAAFKYAKAPSKGYYLMNKVGAYLDNNKHYIEGYVNDAVFNKSSGSKPAKRITLSKKDQEELDTLKRISIAEGTEEAKKAYNDLASEKRLALYQKAREDKSFFVLVVPANKPKLGYVADYERSKYDECPHCGYVGCNDDRSCKKCGMPIDWKLAVDEKSMVIVVHDVKKFKDNFFAYYEDSGVLVTDVISVQDYMKLCVGYTNMYGRSKYFNDLDDDTQSKLSQALSYSLYLADNYDITGLPYNRLIRDGWRQAPIENYADHLRPLETLKKIWDNLPTTDEEAAEMLKYFGADKEFRDCVQKSRESLQKQETVALYDHHVSIKMYKAWIEALEDFWTKYPGLQEAYALLDTEKCPKCGERISITAPRCTNCGAVTVDICKHCGKEIPKYTRNRHRVVGKTTVLDIKDPKCERTVVVDVVRAKTVCPHCHHQHDYLWVPPTAVQSAEFGYISVDDDTIISEDPATDYSEDKNDYEAAQAYYESCGQAPEEPVEDIDDDDEVIDEDEDDEDEAE